MDESILHVKGRDIPPVVSGVDLNAPFEWLAAGWSDFVRNSGASIGYGLAVVAAGYLILGLTAGLPYLYLGAVSGFFLIAPLLAAGLYEISRCQGLGQPSTFSSSLAAMRRNGQTLADFGFVLILVMLCWQMLSALLFAFQFKGNVGDVAGFANSLFLSSDSLGFLLSYLALGGILAALVFSCAVIAVPMIVDREVDVVTAMMTSVAAVRANPKAMLVWAALLVALTAFGFLTLMAGLAIIVPWLGHSSWHAYKALVK